MTNEEALDWLDRFTNNIIQADIDTRKRTLALQAIMTIKTTLEKQIPKKPYEDYNGEIHKEKCPTCHIRLFPGEHHCKCGQALDWGDKE